LSESVSLIFGILRNPSITTADEVQAEGRKNSMPFAECVCQDVLLPASL